MLRGVFDNFGLVSYTMVVLAICAGFALLRFITGKCDKHEEQPDEDPDVLILTTRLKFTPSEVRELMNCKDPEDLVGSGASGKVFRGTLGGQNVAVKKFRVPVVKEFEAEVMTLGAIWHDKIVGLYSCIRNSDVTMLVYEFMENGSLDQWLHGGKGCLGWRTRLSIATDVANGLSYMHHTFLLTVIHRDIKSRNILLDFDFKAKIGDFGLAWIHSNPGKSEPVSAVLGTFGHIAPEYARDGTVSMKVDVYSFGVVLLELLTGKQPHDAGSEPGVSLVEWATQQYRNKAPWDSIIDKDIQNPAYLEDMKAVFKLALSCTSQDRFDRPAMDEVFQQLLLCDPSRVEYRGKKRTTESFGAKVYRNIREKTFRRG